MIRLKLPPKGGGFNLPKTRKIKTLKSGEPIKYITVHKASSRPCFHFPLD
jgi:hypothetical protein